MKIIIILIIIFVIMILAPLIVAWLYFKQTKGVILNIKQDMLKDPRYFSHSFTGMIEKALPTITGNTLKLSREEHFLRPYDLIRTAFIKEPEEINEMVLAVNEDMVFPDTVKTYNKEIYVTGDVALDKTKVTLRAIYSGGRMYLSNKTSIVRWADAENSLSVYDDCDLGMAATSGHVLTIGKNVKFRRLYAPEIYFGQYPPVLIDPMEGRDEATFMLPVIHEKSKKRHITHESTSERGTAPYSVVSSEVTISEGTVLQGDIHTDGNVRIGENAGVLGNIFTEKGILIEKGAFVLGNIFSQGKIEIGDDVMIGKKGNIISVIARDKLVIGKNVVIYGYVSSETQGVCCPIYNYEEKRYDKPYQFASFVEKKINVSFDSLKDYEDAEDMAYRKNPNVLSAVIPEGAESIKRSMFCGCTGLTKVSFPNSVKEIKDYSFMGCTELTEMTSLKDTNIEYIGVSGMENCEKIEKLNFPETLKEVKAAACSGMKGVTEITFMGNNLTALEDHAFRGCSSAKEIYLPDSVEKVGISAFRDCSSLKKLSINEKIKDQPGIAELKEILPDLVVEYRKGVVSAEE